MNQSRWGRIGESSAAVFGPGAIRSHVTIVSSPAQSPSSSASGSPSSFGNVPTPPTCRQRDRRIVSSTAGVRSSSRLAPGAWKAGRSPSLRIVSIVAEVRSPSTCWRAPRSTPLSCRSASSTRPRSSLPMAPARRVRRPSRAATMAGPAAVPAGVIRISSTMRTSPVVGTSSMARPNTSSNVSPSAA